MQKLMKPSVLQRGLTFWGTLVVLTALVLLGTVGMKTLPAYIEFNAVKSTIKKIGRDTNNTTSKSDVVSAFNRQSSVDNIRSIKGAELRYEGGVITADYRVVVPMFGNISLLLDFKATSK